MGKIHELTYPKDQVLEILRTNREAHQAIFEEACEGYQKEAEAILEKHLERVRRGKRIRVSVHLPVPENHVKDYDRIIKMLEMTTDDTIVLSEGEVGMYIQDDWSWKQQFLTSNSTYSGTAAVALGGGFES